MLNLDLANCSEQTQLNFVLHAEICKRWSELLHFTNDKLLVVTDQGIVRCQNFTAQFRWEVLCYKRECVIYFIRTDLTHVKRDYGAAELPETI